MTFPIPEFNLTIALDTWSITPLGFPFSPKLSGIKFIPAMFSDNPLNFPIVQLEKEDTTPFVLLKALLNFDSRGRSSKEVHFGAGKAN